MPPTPEPAAPRRAVRHDPIQIIIEAAVVGSVASLLAGVTVAGWFRDSAAKQPRSLFTVGENVADDGSVTRLLTRTAEADDSGPRVIIGNRPGPGDTWDLSVTATLGTENFRSIQARINGTVRPLTFVPASEDQEARWTLSVPCGDLVQRQALPVEVVYQNGEEAPTIARVNIDTRVRA